MQRAGVGSRSSDPSSNRSVQISHHAKHEVPDFPRIEKVVTYFSKRDPGRLLDIGYCKGSFADHFSRSGWECVGVDLCPRSNANVPVVCCDLHEGIPFASGSFDLLVAGEIIEHMIDQRVFLGECRRLLRKNGSLVITTPNLAYSVNRILVLLGETPLFVHAPYHYHFHTRRTLKTLVEENGFRVTKISASHVLYSRRKHFTGKIFEVLADIFPTFGAHLIMVARKV